LSKLTIKKAWCVDTFYDCNYDDSVSGTDIYYRKKVNTINADLVLLLDILEHVDDDIGLLKEYVEKVPRKTTFLISVPAFQFLWSEHDIYLEHKRRYTLRQLESIVRCSGLKVIHGSYYFGAVFPIAAITRLSGNLFYRKITRKPNSQLKLHHPIVNGILATLSYAELSVFKYNRIAGLTAFCLAESP